MCTTGTARPTTSCATPTSCLVKAAAGLNEAARILCDAFRYADEDIQQAVLIMYRHLRLPPLETLEPACIPAALAKAVTILADESSDLG